MRIVFCFFLFCNHTSLVTAGIHGFVLRTINMRIRISSLRWVQNQLTFEQLFNSTFFLFHNCLDVHQIAKIQKVRKIVDLIFAKSYEKCPLQETD